MGTRSSLAKLAKEIYPGLDAIDENVVSLDDNNAFGGSIEAAGNVSGSSTSTGSFGHLLVDGTTVTAASLVGFTYSRYKGRLRFNWGRWERSYWF